jgi:HNH endonuclease
MRPVERGNAPAFQTLRGNEVARQVKEYGYYRPFLVERLGEYCSYCEVPLGVNLAVEHMLSKTQSINDKDWNNLLLGCTNCNSHKSDKTVDKTVLSRYFWPSISNSRNFNTFDMLTYELKETTVSNLVAAGVLKDKKSYPDKTTAKYTYVWVYPSATPPYKANRAKILDTILMMGLNDFTPEDSDPKASDRRLFNRTTAWQRAKAMANLLSNYYQANQQDSQAALLLRDQIKETAIATGFWSVWVTVFKAGNFQNDTLRNELLTDLFINTKSFPGTAYTL